MPKRDPIVVTWEEGKASREEKRANLRAVGLDVPSRRTHGVGKVDQRLRAVFAGKRVPTFAAGLMMALVAVTATAAVPFKNGTRFALKDVPGELVVERRAGDPVRFALEENGTTGYLWAAAWNTNECDVALEHRGATTKNERGELLCGAAGTLDVSVTSKIYTPVRIEFAYRRSWEKGVKPIRALKLIVCAAGEPPGQVYPTIPAR